MLFVIHRQNETRQLLTVPPHFGVEVDLRSTGNDLILQHDPFTRGELFEEWLGYYRHRLLILNLKEEGLEAAALNLLSKYGVEDFFFLDQSFPFLIRFSEACLGRTAVRFSDLESLDTAKNTRERVKWLWVDSFENSPISPSAANEVKELGLKVCVVSPELHGNDPQLITNTQETIFRTGFPVDAVCTKFPNLWKPV